MMLTAILPIDESLEEYLRYYNDMVYFHGITSYYEESIRELKIEILERKNKELKREQQAEIGRLFKTNPEEAKKLIERIKNNESKI